MGNPMWSYNRMILEADRLLSTHGIKELSKPDISIDQLEEDLLKYPHTEQYEMLLKEAAKNIVEDIVKNGTCDEINACIGGLASFYNWFNLDDDNDGD